MGQLIVKEDMSTHSLQNGGFAVPADKMSLIRVHAPRAHGFDDALVGWCIAGGHNADPHFADACRIHVYRPEHAEFFEESSEWARLHRHMCIVRFMSEELVQSRTCINRIGLWAENDSISVKRDTQLAIIDGGVQISGGRFPRRAAAAPLAAADLTSYPSLERNRSMPQAGKYGARGLPLVKLPCRIGRL